MLLENFLSQATLPPPVAAPRIGLVNLMPARVAAAAVSQFRAVLGPNIRLRCFSPLAPASAQGMEPVAALWDAALDGLIVTGTEPAGGAMAAEPLLPLIASIADWAAGRTSSTIWSCFSAHAALFHLSGIPRRRLDQKLSGVFACTRAAGSELLPADLLQWNTPHSRHNTVDEALLAAAGYTIVSRSPRAGLDIAARTVGGSRFLFFQGHPEYARATLALEYLRDQARFASGGISVPPAPLETAPGQDWQPAARAIFSSWLDTLPGPQAFARPQPHAARLAS